MIDSSAMRMPDSNAIIAICSVLSILGNITMFLLIRPLLKERAENKKLREDMDDLKEAQVYKRLKASEEKLASLEHPQEGIRAVFTRELKAIEKGFQEALKESSRDASADRKEETRLADASRLALDNRMNSIDATLRELKGATEATNKLTSEMMSNALNQLVTVSKEAAYTAGKAGA
jgi:DNA-binding HxlR family transcriptional regulator